MSNKIEVGRALLANFIEYSAPLNPGDEAWLADKQELRALLDAPYWRPLTPEDLRGPIGSISGVSFHVASAMAEQPAPVSVDLSELREYHAKAVTNLKAYADDSGLRDSDVKHYAKRAKFHVEMVALIDKVKELNP